MLKKSVTLVLLATMATAVAWTVPTALGQDAKTILNNVSKAMGADNLKTVQYSGTATEFAFGQAVNPSSPWPGFAETSYTRTINYETPAWRVDRVLAPIPAGSPWRRSASRSDPDRCHWREYFVGPTGGPVDDPLWFLKGGRQQ